MKANRFLFVPAAALALLATSCLKDQEDVFEESSSARMSSFLEDVRTTLTSAEKGWSLDYYPGTAYAGTSYVLQFTSQKVTASHESDPGVSETSTYKLTNDDGAVLSFDTYNSLLHMYATPDSRNYQAKGGDFEFEIVSCEPDEIVLCGKRSRNKCFLHPLAKDGKSYLAAIADMDGQFDIAAVSATITGGAVEGFLDAGTRTLTIGRKGAESDETISARYIITETGIRFASPFELQGVVFSELTFNQEEETLTGSGIVFDKMIPEGWVSYADFLGTYTLYYYNGSRSFQVELVEKEKGKTFEMEGLSTYFKPELGYNGGYGRLTWVKQSIGGNGSIEYILAPWDSDAGYLTWMDGVGLDGAVVDNSIDDFTVEFTDNGVWGSYIAKGWLLWQMQDGSSAGSLSSWTMASGSYQLPGTLSMTKKL
ncbi:MAG: DUF4302 domain-containing protein [Bacteroidales bacterium]|nr:DUF4302 domain-containing protein [Bacteroidales bacterium]